MSTDAAQVPDASRRDFLKKVAIGGTAALGVAAAAKALSHADSSDPTANWWEGDSAFKPRSDQLKRVLGK